MSIHPLDNVSREIPAPKSFAPFKIQNHFDPEDDKENDVEDIENVSQLFSDDDIKTVAQSKNDDEELHML